MRTENWQSNTRGLRLVGEGESGSASTIFGPVKAGLTTSQPTSKEAQLSELLKCLEKEVESLRYRYLEVCAILENDIIPRVKQTLSLLEKNIIR